MEIICDTNIFYDIASGKLDPSKIRKNPADKIVLTPISALELISKITPATFPSRQGAARAVLQCVDEVCIDPERHLAAIWGVSIGSLTVDWMQAMKAFDQATDMNHLMNGVHDFGDGVVRTINALLATTWRTSVYEDFADEMVGTVDRFVPGYAAARRAKKMIQANVSTIATLRAGISSPVIYNISINTTFLRLLLHDPNLVKPSIIPVKALDPYIRIYQEYFLDCCTRAPTPNDWGDLEMFLYAQGNSRIFTQEKKWAVMANATGQQGWLY